MIIITSQAFKKGIAGATATFEVLKSFFLAVHADAKAFDSAGEMLASFVLPKKYKYTQSWQWTAVDDPYIMGYRTISRELTPACECGETYVEEGGDCTTCGANRFALYPGAPGSTKPEIIPYPPDRNIGKECFECGTEIKNGTCSHCDNIKRDPNVATILNAYGITATEAAEKIAVLFKTTITNAAKKAAGEIEKREKVRNPTATGDDNGA